MNLGLRSVVCFMQYGESAIDGWETSHFFSCDGNRSHGEGQSVEGGRRGQPSFPDEYEITQKAVLQVTDIKTNRNKYYAIELHTAQNKRAKIAYRVFTHYGRTDDLETNPDSGQKENRYFDSLGRGPSRLPIHLQPKDLRSTRDIKKSPSLPAKSVRKKPAAPAAETWIPKPSKKSRPPKPKAKRRRKKPTRKA